MLVFLSNIWVINFDNEIIIRHDYDLCTKHNKGHSRQEGLFMYGCPLDYPEEVSETDFQKSLSPFLFPQIYDRNSEFFTSEGCNFNSHLCKASTMRMVMVKELGITCAYTPEASLSGHRGCHFSSLDLQNMGGHYLRSLLEFSRYIFFDGVPRKVEQSTMSHDKTPSGELLKSQSQYCFLSRNDEQKRSDKDIMAVTLIQVRIT